MQLQKAQSSTKPTSITGKSFFMQCMQNYLALAQNNGANSKSFFMYLWNEKLKCLHYSSKKKSCPVLQNTGFTLFRKTRIPSVRKIILIVYHLWAPHSRNQQESSSSLKVLIPANQHASPKGKHCVLLCRLSQSRRAEVILKYILSEIHLTVGIWLWPNLHVIHLYLTLKTK